MDFRSSLRVEAFNAEISSLREKDKFSKFQSLFSNFVMESSIHGFVFMSESSVFQRLVEYLKYTVTIQY
jgi:hypothetical protein